MRITGGPIQNQTLKIHFPHLNGSTPGFQNLTQFTTSPNVVIVSNPTLHVPANSGVWSYTLTVKITNDSAGYVYFMARLAAGAHLNTGSSLMLSGDPSSMGNLQIHKPGPGYGAPDLAIVKKGPETVMPGSVITYTLAYTNHNRSSSTVAEGVQISDILPPELIAVEASLGNGELVGHTIFWDLPPLKPGDAGVVSFKALVATNTPFGHSFINFSQILSAEDDRNYADNFSTFTTCTVSCTPPNVALGPKQNVTCPGDTLTLVAEVTGTAPFTFQWQKDGADIGGATNSSFTISDISIQDEGDYGVVVRNLCGFSTTGDLAQLIVKRNLEILSSPQHQVQCAGGSATFAVNATGSDLSFQWFKGANALPGQTGSSLLLKNISSADAGTYSVVVSGTCGNAVTNSATLTVNQNVVVSTAPISLTNCPGSTATFAVNASGIDLAFQWFKGANALPGKTGNSLLLQNVSAADAGTYSVVVSGTCGNAVTNSATLTVNQNVVVATAPISLTNCPGSTATFAVNASGTDLAFQWFKGASALPSQTGNSLLLQNVSSADAGTYSVVVSGTCGNAVTNSATLTVNQNV
ncbi:MAG TPA: immunoglobulin domain-containing protein, partial [Clostridia bacterium]|nr:immunoglobulin domain-containing protein [Clostridia bacterium]